MSATNAFENGLLGLIFQNADLANVGDAIGLRGSSTAGVFYISLHTADPGETGAQTTNETSYTNYARVSVARSSSNWAVSSGVADNVNAITFPQCGTTGATITHVGIGSSSTGAGNLFISGSATSSLAVSNGITPEIAAGNLDISCD